VTKMTDTAATAAIGAATRELRLPVVRADAARLAEIAQRSQMSYLAFLAEVLSVEVDERAERRRQRRVTEARFPRVKRLGDFDLSAAPTVNPATIATLASCAYLDAGEPIVLLGDSGTGKTHLLIGLGMAACEQGRRVRYATAAQLVNELVEAADERRLSRIVARYGRLDLLCLDELGYVQLDGRGSELLFQILTEREEKASVALASNLPFSEWGTIIPDPRLVAAIVDRVTFNAHIIETGTESYRLRTTKARTRRKPAGPSNRPHPSPIPTRDRASTGHTDDGSPPSPTHQQPGAKTSEHAGANPG
jgi:DNA replication protein DnaC